MAKEEARLGWENKRLICFPLSGASSFLFFFGISDRRPQLDGSELRRYHADSSVKAVPAHVYISQTKKKKKKGAGLT